MRQLPLLCAALAASVCVRGAAADDAAKASAEPRVLEQYVGTWDEEVTNKPTEAMPKAEKSTVITKRSWSLGGKFVRGEGRWQPAGTEFLHLLAFDPEAKVFRSWYFDSAGAMPRGSAAGTWDEKTKTITWRGTDEGGTKMSGTHRFIDRDRQEWTYVVTNPAGKVVFDLAGKCMRRKE